jgi:hypothetical protein
MSDAEKGAAEPPCYFVDEMRVIAENDAFAAGNSTVTDHISMIGVTLALLSKFFAVRQARSGSESALLVLGGRIYNSSAAALHLARAGYYQAALTLVRDLVETINLVDYFLTHKADIESWVTLPDKLRQNKFGPKRIRDILNKRDRLPRDVREEYYKALSGLAAHPTFHGANLLVRDDKIIVGPFADGPLVEGILALLTKFAVFGAQLFLRHFEDVEDMAFLAMVHTYNQIFLAWQKRHVPNAVFRA